MKTSTLLSLSLLLGIGLLTSSCTHQYGLQIRGVAPAKTSVRASHWVQSKAREAPHQVIGAVSSVDEAGHYQVASNTELDFAGPPPHVVVEFTGGAAELCVSVPTKGLWDSGEGTKSVELPPLRALAPGEASYELSVPGLPAGIFVIRKDPARSCALPGK